MKFLSLIIITSLHLLNASTPTKLSCDYEFHYYDVVGSIYQCDVDNVLSITSKDQAIIGSASESHYGMRTNSDVSGISMNNKYIQYFPIGLEKIFKNIKLIHAQNNFIQEVDQSDLKHFPELAELNLHNNEIKTIEKGLFDYNPKLVYVSFSNNKIFYIHHEVFDGLKVLTYLYLNSNTCIDKGAYLSRSEVLNVLDYVKSDCLGLEYQKIEEKFKELEDESTDPHIDFKYKLDNLEAEFNRSSVFNLTSIIERLNKLKMMEPKELIEAKRIPCIEYDERDVNDGKSSGIAYEIILILVIAISVALFGSIIFLFVKLNRID
ncbi:uncharacterized protein [Chironomus tepperi]|uniref:uncharacterized protein n=1 Tax=Chironomus tepperi TaxID=113505 RepID=UPI00391FB87A